MVNKSRVISLIFAALMLFQFGACTVVEGPKHLNKNEAILKQDLYSLRMAIDQYTQDKNRAPESLEDLVRAGYIRTIPTDPFTNSTTTWKLIQEDQLQAIDKKHPGITDVHSGSNAISSDRSPYSTW